MDSRTRQAPPESGGRAGDDGHQGRKGAQVQLAVETLGHLLALLVTPAKEQDRAQGEVLAAKVPAVSGERVTWADVDQGSTGDQPAADAAAHGIQLAVVKLPEATRGFVLLPKRRIVARDCAWSARFGRRARDYERLPTVLAGRHFVVFTGLMLAQWLHFISSP